MVQSTAKLTIFAEPATQMILLFNEYSTNEFNGSCLLRILGFCDSSQTSFVALFGPKDD